MKRYNDIFVLFYYYHVWKLKSQGLERAQTITRIVIEPKITKNFGDTESYPLGISAMLLLNNKIRQKIYKTVMYT